MPIKSRGFAATDPGAVRSQNEDVFCVNDSLGLYAVCDGVGGSLGGAQAAQIAMEEIERVVQARRSELDAQAGSSAAALRGQEVLQEAANAACSAILQFSHVNPGRGRMATTATIVLICGEKAVLGHVGDSRLYLVRGGSVHQLSRDHTLANDLLERGLIAPDDVQIIPYHHAITRSLGAKQFEQLDTLIFDLLVNDVLVLCSDGFSNCLENDHELSKLIDADRLHEAPAELVRLACIRDGSDNATVVILRLTAETNESEQQQRTDDVTRLLETLKGMYMFQDLTLQELLVIAEFCCVEVCTENEILVREGDPADNLYIILDGVCAVERGASEIAVLKRGNHFGEMALLNEGRRTATVRSMTAARLISIDRESFIRLVRQESRIGVKLLWRIADRLSDRLEKANLAAWG